MVEMQLILGDKRQDKILKNFKQNILPLNCLLLSERTAMWFMPVVLTETEKENDSANQNDVAKMTLQNDIAALTMRWQAEQTTLFLRINLLWSAKQITM